MSDDDLPLDRDEAPQAQARSGNPSLTRRVSIIITATLVFFLGVYAAITTVIEGRRFDAAVEKDLLLLDAVVTAARARLSDAFQLGDTTFLREQLRHIAGEIPGVVVARAYDPSGQLQATLQPVRDDDPLGSYTPGGPPRGVSRLGNEEVAWLARPVHLQTALGAGEGPLLGHLVLGTSQAKNNEARWTSTAVLIIVGALLLGAMVVAVQVVVSRTVARPLRGFSDGSRRIARGDLAHRFPDTGADEIATLGLALNAMIADLGAMIRTIREGAAQVDANAEQIVGAARVSVEDARAQEGLLVPSEEAAGAVMRLLTETVRSIDSLRAMSEAVTVSTAELEVAIHEVTRAAERMRDSIGDVTGAAAAEVDAIRRVNLAIGELGTFVTETAERARSMDETLRRVEAAVRESVDLAETLTGRAARSADAVAAARGGMEEIRRAFAVTSDGIARLRGHSSQVVEVVRVIDGVTKQVNLLALNASLIAQRGGEHGQSFGVVAAEIRDLAERTAAAAAKIGALIELYEKDLGDCVASVRQGREAVDLGAELTAEAQSALAQLLEASTQASAVVRAITDRTERHVTEAKRIDELVGAIRDRVGRIARLMSQQAEESHRILDSAQRMEGATRDAQRAASAQSRGGQLIAQTMARTREIVREATEISAEQTRVMNRLAELLHSFQELTGRSLRRADGASGSLRELRDATGSLTKEVQKFNL